MSAIEPAERRIFTLLVEMRCNSFCVFCGSREIDEALIRNRRRLGLSVVANLFSTGQRYSLASATEALRAARAAGFTEVSFQGGEPTLFPSIVPLVAAASTMGFDFLGLVTNGRRLADRAFAADLLDAGLDGLTFSLLGPDAATHDALAAADGSFDQLLAGIDHCVAHVAAGRSSASLNVTLIVSARSLEHLAAEVRLVAAHGVRSASLHLLKFDGLASDPLVAGALRFDPAALERPLAEARAVARSLGVHLNESELPFCRSGDLSSERLELVRKRRVQRHGYAAAGHAEDHVPATLVPACGRCLIAGACPGIRREPGVADGAAVTADSLVASAREVVRGGDETLLERACEHRRGLVELAPLLADPAAVAGAVAVVDAALGALLVGAARRREARRVVDVFFAALGLVVPPDVALGTLFTLLAIPEPTLVERSRARRQPLAPDEPGWVFPYGFALAFEVESRSVVGVVPGLAGAALGAVASAVARRLFLALVALPLDRAWAVDADARELRVGDERGGIERWRLRYPDGAARR